MNIFSCGWDDFKAIVDAYAADRAPVVYFYTAADSDGATALAAYFGQ